MRVTINNQLISSIEYTPNHRGDMNCFKVTLKDVDDKGQIAIVYLFSHRDSTRTKRLMALLKKGNRLSAELTIILDPESGGERNVAMITRIISSIPPTPLPLTA